MVKDTINFHVTDVCNYKCYFCFVHKHNHFLTIKQAKLIVDKIKKHFDSLHIRGRINLAGGEPLCYPHIQELIDYIYSLGIEVSIITNGSLLTESFIYANKNKLKMIGISVDSLDPKVNINLGRCQNNKTLGYNKLLSLCQIIKECKIKLKINHCVCKKNLNSDIVGFIKLIKPDRFKIFQVVPDNPFSKLNSITIKEFNDYLNKYKGIEFVKEDANYMLEHYLIVDSLGNITRDNTHTRGISLLENNEISDYLKTI